MKFRRLTRKQRKLLTYRTKEILHNLKLRGYWYVRSLTNKKNEQLWKRARIQACKEICSCKNYLRLNIQATAPLERRGFCLVRENGTNLSCKARTKVSGPVLRGTARAPAGSYRFGFDHTGRLTQRVGHESRYKQDYHKNLKFFNGRHDSAGSFKVIIHFITRFGATARLLKSIARILSLQYSTRGREALDLARSLSRSLVQLSHHLGKPVVKPSQ